MCQSCHADPALGAPGVDGIPNFSTALHGWHANYMAVEGAEACALCHPVRADGNTRCLRGIHPVSGKNCVDCHGTLEEHALSLLNAEAGKGQVDLLRRTLTARVPADQVNPRTPWLNEPDCLTCHVDFEQPAEGASGFNKWVPHPSQLYRFRLDGGGLRCEGCHGATHAIYPAKNPYAPNRDVLQPLQYSGMPYAIGSNGSCAVCHTRKMTVPVHHRNMGRPVRNEISF